MSDVTYMYESCHTLGGLRRVGILHLAHLILTARCVCHMYELVMSRTCMSREVCGHSGWFQEGGYIYFSTSDADCQVCVSRVCTGHVTCMYESCTHMYESCHIYVSLEYMYESRHIYASHIHVYII